MVLFVKLKAIFNEYHNAMYDAVTSVGDNVSDVSDAALDACATIDVLALGTHASLAHLSVTFTACVADTAVPSTLTRSGLTVDSSAVVVSALVLLLFTLGSVFLSAVSLLLPAAAACMFTIALVFLLLVHSA